MGTYSYDKKAFTVGVTFTGVFAVCIFAACIVGFFMGKSPSLMALVALVAAYTAWNDFVSISNPEIVIIDEDSISFSAYGREHKYRLDDITSFRLREFPTSGKIFLRINKYGSVRGRYWIHTKMFNDSKILFDKLRDMEYSIHPDSLKARARRVNTEYIEAKKQSK